MKSETKNNEDRLEELTRKLTGFHSFEEMAVCMDGGYIPTLGRRRPEEREFAALLKNLRYEIHELY